MALTFDPNDRDSWYHGPMSRQEANDLLMVERDGGVFLVRDSKTMRGDFVLCVKEDSRVSHYIINRITQDGQYKYRIGDQVFADLPKLLSFYKQHYLDTTPLVRPAMKKLEKVIAKYDFHGRDMEDLPFQKGEVLTVVSKDEEQWWKAKNRVGQIGDIPVNYVEKYQEPPSISDAVVRHTNGPRVSSGSSSSGTRSSGEVPVILEGGNPSPTPLDASASPPQVSTEVTQRRLPALCRVKKPFDPSPYDHEALRLKEGDEVKVTKMNPSGTWEGEFNGRTGKFPFTHVEFIDGTEEELSRLGISDD